MNSIIIRQYEKFRSHQSEEVNRVTRKSLSIMAIAILSFALQPLYGQTRALNGRDKTVEKGASITIAGNALTLEQAIDLVLQHNLTLQSAKYDVIMSDSDLEKFKGRYGTTANLEGGYVRQKTPPTGLSAFTGDKQYQYDLAASLSRKFSSGTNITAGVKETFFDANDPAIAGFKEKEPAYHKPSLFISLEQELLRNAFGYGERLQKTMLKSAAEIQRAAIINQLSTLVVSTLVDYWTITIQKSALENARRELESDRQVRDIIAGNVRYGLGELYDLNQYNALVASAEIKVVSTEQAYREAVRKLLRTMNMPADTRVEGVTDLVDTLPELDADAAVKTGYLKRVDYRNAVASVENARRELAYYRNESLPSLTVNLNLNTASQREGFNDAAGDAAAAKYPSWEVRAKLSYPLDDRERETNVRNAELKLRQARIGLDRTKLEVRDEILNALEQVRTRHLALKKARTARAESELYYQRLLVRFRQGKATAVTVRLALDALMQSRQSELESLVTYNVTLLQFDLAKNEIFDRYNVNVEKYIKQVK